MKKNIAYYLICILLIAATIDLHAGNKSYKGKSNVYSGKKYKGPKCPPKRKVINAIYY